MQYRHLGRSGAMVSAIAYGNWFTHAGQVDESTAVACVRAALDAGITTFDTADMYAAGEAESLLGRALAGVDREGVEICTKVYFPMGPRPNDRGLSRKHIVEGVNASLRRLRTDHVDVLYAHRYDVESPLEETLKAFDDLVRQGKVHYIGVSEWTAKQIGDALRVADGLGLDRIVVSQPQYSLLWRVIDAEVAPLCTEEGIGQVVFSPLAQGVLTGKYLPGAAVPDESRASAAGGRDMVGFLLRDDILRPVQSFVALAREAGYTPAVLALAWVLKNPDVCSAVIGASRPEQVQENVRASEVNVDQDVWRAVEAVLDPAAVRDSGLVHTLDERP